MTTRPDPAPISRRRPTRLRFVLTILAVTALVAGIGAIVLQSAAAPVSAAQVSFSQCNGRGAGVDGAPLSVTCSVSVVNTIDASGGSSSVVYERICTLNDCTGDTVSSTDVVNAVHQCNDSDNVGGSATLCSVDIVNNISIDAPAAATALTVNQCVGSGQGGGTNMDACVPSSQGSPTVTQCNGSGNGGGGFMACSASGTVSADFPVTVDQCNGSENGGGSTVTCTATVTTNVVDTSSSTSTSASSASTETTAPGSTSTASTAPGPTTPGSTTPGSTTPPGQEATSTTAAGATTPTLPIAPGGGEEQGRPGSTVPGTGSSTGGAPTGSSGSGSSGFPAAPAVPASPGLTG